MERTNDMWLAELREGHPQQAQALEELRHYLKRGVLAYLHTRSDLNRAGIAANERGFCARGFVKNRS